MVGEILTAGDIGRLPASSGNAATNDKIPGYDTSTGKLVYFTPDQIASGASAVDGPASATPDGVPRFNGSTGKIIKDSVVTIADTTGAIASGNITTTGTGGSVFNSTSVDSDFKVKAITSGDAISYDAGTSAIALASTTIGLTGTTTLTGDVNIAGAASELSIAKTTNQFILGTTNTITINSVAPAVSRTIIIPDPGANGSAVISGGNAAVTLTGTGGTSTGTMTTLSAQVTSASITTAGGATHVATITYTGLAATDIVLITKAGGSNNATENYSYKAVCTTNTITVTLSNNTAATALNGTVIFNILVVKV